MPLGETLAAGGSFTIDPGGQGKFGPDLEWVTEHDYTVDPTKVASFVAAVRKYWDGLDAERLQPAYAGIRPRAYGPEDPAGLADRDGSRTWCSPRKPARHRNAANGLWPSATMLLSN